MRSIAAITFLLLGSLGGKSIAASLSAPDAALRAVRFVDKNEGWAVGDQGGIWHTIDGGKNWERRPTGSRVSFRALHFLTPYTGYVVGRSELPHGLGSVGTVWFTSDGGATWKELISSSLSGLNAVKFFDENNGIVAGAGTDVFPSGAFRTKDGGKSWTPIPGPRVDEWTSIEFSEPNNGFLCSASGVAECREGKIGVMRMLASRANLVKFDSGVRLLTSGDPPSVMAIPEKSVAKGEVNSSALEIHGYSVVGDHLWCTGRPGSMILHSCDRGKNWESIKTPCTTTLHDVWMLNENTGWAVGELGVILATEDGGKTWRVQKVGGMRSAILFVHARSSAIPLGAVAKLAQAESWLAAAWTVAPDSETRIASAMRSVGGAAGEVDGTVHWPSYMMESPGENEPALLKTGRDPKLIERLVLALRTWRPEVVVTDTLSPDSPLCDQIVILHMKEAFIQAANPKAFPEHIEKLGLSVHAAKKLYCLSPLEKEANVIVETDDYHREMGTTIRNFSEPAAALLDATMPESYRFRLVAHRLPGSEKHKELMEGIALAEGGSGRRPKVESSPIVTAEPAEVRKNARSRRNLERVADDVCKRGLGEDATESMRQMVGDLIALPPDSAARTGVGIADRLFRAGKWTEAREIYAQVAKNWPEQPESVEACRWLVRYYSSGEVRRRIELGHMAIYQKSAFQRVGQSSGPIRLVDHSTGYSIDATQNQTHPTHDDIYRLWNEAGLDLQPKLAAFGAAYARDPATNLCLAASLRKLGFNDRVEKGLRCLVSEDDAGTDAWRTRMADELRLLTNKTPLSNANMECHVMRGEVNTGARKNPVASISVQAVLGKDMDGGDDGYQTEANFHVHGDFLYVSARCKRPEGNYPPLVEMREPDMDLRGHDRIEILLDTDRDYQTYYRFRVDHRGCTAEDCWGDSHWNPKWTVKMHSTSTEWSFEAAIPITELTGTMPRNGDVWAMNVVRVIPGVGVRSWASVTDAEPRPEAMGLMKFKEAK